MNLHKHGLTRAQLRQGSGTFVGPEHFPEVFGSSDFTIYLTPNKKVKGYDDLKKFLAEQGCEVRVLDDAPLLPGKGYKALRITFGGEVMADAVLERAHRWAHHRNYLHSFFRPLTSKSS